MTGRLHHASFRAMGTACTLAVTATRADLRRAGRALAAGQAEVAACERALSRFDPASDLSRLNEARGAWVEIGPRLVDALRVALRAREVTGGRFDPTILPALVAAGYDRTFEQLEDRPARRVAGWRAAAEVEVVAAAGRARVESGAAVDLGGIGKGFSATRALWAMRDAWLELPGGLVDLGGDIAVWGITPDRGPWRVAIADPRTPDGTLGILHLEGGGVATSGRNARRFGPGGELHHLIDPGTGAPAVAGPLAITVVAPDAAEAEGHATALAISSLDVARAHLSAFPEAAALYVPRHGAPVAIGKLPLGTEIVLGAAA